MKDCSNKLVVLTKNNAKQRMNSGLKKGEEIKLYLKKILSEKHYILIQNVQNIQNYSNIQIFKIQNYKKIVKLECTNLMRVVN